MNVKLIALDIDGTLVDNYRNPVSLANCRAIQRAREAGVEVTLVTGRRFSTASPVALQLALSLPIIVHNGAIIRSPLDHSTFASSLLPQELSALVIEIMRDHHSEPLIYDAHDGVGNFITYQAFDPGNPWIREYFDQNRQFIRPVDDLAMACKEGAIRILVAEEEEKVDMISVSLKETLGEDIQLSKTVGEAYGLCTLSVQHPDCTKAKGIMKLIERLGILPSEILAMGDNFNDLEMLRFAGVGIVMGNARDDMKALGYFVTDSCENDGVARAIEKFLFESVDFSSQSL
ncbi:MAG: HAD family phosphatase [Candidatus Tectomicrobia bacterium]|nr:HAD family phosphatase [Candidatus Tectomicrobia bacterium]